MADPTQTAVSSADEPAHELDADRRDSQRIPIHLLVRDAALGGSFEPYEGNLALGGVFYENRHPPAGSRVELRFLLPGVPGEIRANGEVLRVSQEGERFGAHVRFSDLPLDSELAIARFLQEN